MTQDEFRQSMGDRFDRCLAISKAKNADYCGDTDPFGNFKNSTIAGVPVSRGLMVRIMDKISRLSVLDGGEGQVEDEKVDDTIDDAINYLAILGAWYESQKHTTSSDVDGIQQPKRRKRRVKVHYTGTVRG